jgi:hypothetical protein
VDGDNVNVWNWSEQDLPRTPPGAMVLVHSTEPPARITSYKARWPYLVAEAYIDAKVLVMDIATGDMIREYSLDESVTDMGRVCHV